jgi:hypothetical protein
MAQLRAGATEVMRSKARKPELLRVIFDDVPNDPFRPTLTPCVCRAGKHSSIDCAPSELTIFENDAVPGHHNLVERQPWLGAVPLDKFVDRVSITALRLWGAQAI